MNGESDASRCVLAARLPIGATRALLSTSLADDPLEDGARVEYARSRTISIIDSIGFVKNAVFGGGPRTMRVWWDEVGATGDLSRISTRSIDQRRFDGWDAFAGWADPDQRLPTTSPPSDLRRTHQLINEAVFALVQAQRNVNFEGLSVGLAAGFCNPSLEIPPLLSAELEPRRENVTRFDFDLVVETLADDLAARAEALQTWRRSGGDCDPGDRGLPKSLIRGRQLSFFEDYRWGCPAFGELGAQEFFYEAGEFGIDVRSLAGACAAQRIAELTFESAFTLWEEALAESCGVDPSAGKDILAECGDPN